MSTTCYHRALTAQFSGITVEKLRRKKKKRGNKNKDESGGGKDWCTQNSGPQLTYATKTQEKDKNRRRDRKSFPSAFLRIYATLWNYKDVQLVFFLFSFFSFVCSQGRDYHNVSSLRQTSGISLFLPFLPVAEPRVADRYALVRSRFPFRLGFQKLH